MSHEYAATLYMTSADAADAFVIDWFTSGGMYDIGDLDFSDIKKHSVREHLVEMSEEGALEGLSFGDSTEDMIVDIIGAIERFLSEL